MLNLRLKIFLRASLCLKVKCSKPLVFQTASYFSDKKPPKGRYNFYENSIINTKGFEKFQKKSEEKEDSTEKNLNANDDKNKEDEPKNEQQEQKDNIDKKENDKIHKKDPKSASNVNSKKNKIPPKKQQTSFQYDVNPNKNKDNKNKKNDDMHSNRNNSGSKDDGPENKPGSAITKILFGALALTLSISFLSELLWDKHTITYLDFIKNYVDKGQVRQIVIKRAHRFHKLQTIATIKLDQGVIKQLVIHNIDYFLTNLETHQVELNIEKDQFIPIEFVYEPPKSDGRFIKCLMLGLSLYIMFIIFKSTRGVGKMYEGSSNLFGIGGSNAKIFGIDNNVKVRFKDVAGLNEAKVEISEFVDFLKQPIKYSEIGAKLPRGALLTGPPGTGKTMLAKACAGEAGVPFFYISGSDFVELFVGLGATRVRDLFKQAKSKAPSIIFIDEIDAVGKKRDTKMGRSNDERDNTLNQLLVEMDGFGTNSQVVVLAATNRHELLDPALTRPGRFDRSIEVSLPDIEGRFNIFLVHLTPLKLNPEKSKEEYAKRLATLTPGFSGADIANLCNEAAILAARNSKKQVDTIDFEMAAERIIAGLERKKFLSDEERKTIATHEAGHAVISWFLEGGNPLLKLTIIPRSKGSLGFAQYLPNESTLQTKEELLDQICCILGGRCSEEHFFHKITTGAYDDLDKAYKLAHAIVTKFGMSKEIGYIGFTEEEYKKNYSDYTQDIIDKEISKIISECTQRTRELIIKFQEFINKLRDSLLEKETLDLNAIIDILGERPFPPKSNFKAYLKTKREIVTEKDAK